MEKLKRFMLTGIACLTIGASAFGVGNGILQARQSICIAENADARTLSNLLIFFEGRTLQSKTITPQQRAETIAFYQASLKQIPAQKTC